MRADWSISSPLHNRLAAEDRTVHGWYRFVLSFPPHLVREYLEKFNVQKTATVLDPFSGTGTTVVECKKLGIDSVGVEANRMAFFAGNTKSDWSPDPVVLSQVSTAICEKALTATPQIDFNAGTSFLVKEQFGLFGLNDITIDQRELILKDSISPLPLHRSLQVLNGIDEAPAELHSHLKLALAWTLVSEAGNLRFGPEVGITKPKQDAAVEQSWLHQVERMSLDISDVSEINCGKSRMILGDARDLSQLPDESIDYVFTSPPYPNEKDYTRTTRLESVILGFIKNKADLRQLKQGLLRSNTRNVYVGDTDDKYISEIKEIGRLAAEIEAKRIELGKTSGFERLYHRVTKLYFGGMSKHFIELQRVLKPGAILGYVVGDQASYLKVMIRTGELLAEIAEYHGYEVVQIDLFRTRYATATKAQMREEVVILRWPGKS